jgi:hypothetical protein
MMFGRTIWEGTAVWKISRRCPTSGNRWKIEEAERSVETGMKLMKCRCAAFLLLAATVTKEKTKPAGWGKKEGLGFFPQLLPTAALLVGEKMDNTPATGLETRVAALSDSLEQSTITPGNAVGDSTLNSEAVEVHMH